MSECLFRTYDFANTLRNSKDSIRDKVNSINAEKFSKSTDDEVFEHVYSEYVIGVPLEIHEELEELTTVEVKYDLREHGERSRWLYSMDTPVYVPATKFLLKIPFTGDSKFFHFQPDHFKLGGHPIAVINKNNITLEYLIINDEIKDGKTTAKRIENRFADIKKEIHFYLDHLTRMAKDFDAEIIPIIRAHIETRRKQTSNISSVLQNIKIPLAKKEGAPSFTQLPVRKRIVVPLPTRNLNTDSPIYGISDADYAQILSVIRLQGNAFERTPKTFYKLDEEELRDVFLSNLNSYYESGANGETFNKGGKTDILIREGSKAAFIAECKNWSGKEMFHKTIDQLLGYLTWRDCKTSIILFNKKNKDFSAIQAQISGLIQSHSKFVRVLSLTNEPNEWTAVFKSKDDDGRHIMIHFFVFNLYTFEAKMPKHTKSF